MKMVEILHRYYGDFDLINEKWNEDYESILIKPKVDHEYKRCRLAKKTPKKEGYFTVFWKKDHDNKNIPYTDRDLGDELVIVVIDDCHCGLFIIPKEVAISKKILSTKDCKGKMAMRFYPSWCSNLNKTAGLFSKNRIRRISFSETRQSLVSQFCLLFLLSVL